MAQIRLNASLYRISKDSEGQVRLTLTVPKINSLMAIMIPEETELLVTIETLGSMHGFDVAEGAAAAAGDKASESNPAEDLEGVPIDGAVDN